MEVMRHNSSLVQEFKEYLWRFLTLIDSFRGNRKAAVNSGAVSTSSDCQNSASESSNEEKRHNFTPAPSSWSPIWSKDTGLNSTSQTTDSPTFCDNFTHITTMSRMSGICTLSPEGFVSNREIKQRSDSRTSNKEERESQKEQVCWRLERLLGVSCKETKIAGEAHPPSESICTEDFASCFREAMVELSEESMVELDEEAGPARKMMFDSGTRQDEQNRLSVFSISPVTNGGVSDNKENSLHKSGQRKKVVRCLFSSSEAKRSNRCGEEAAGQRYTASLGLSDERCTVDCTDVATEREQTRRNNSNHLVAECLAGVPLWNFDTFSCDSDFESVCTQQIRQRLCRRPVQTSACENARCSSPLRAETCRAVHSMCSDDKDRDGELNPRGRRRRPESVQSEWLTIKDHLFFLKQKCEKEEEALRLRKTHLTEVELILSELQLRRKHALQDLERLTAETAEMEQEKRHLESSLKDSKAERDSMRCQLRQLQRQRECYIHEVRGIEEEIVTLNQQRKALKDESSVETNIVVSVLERQELERQLDVAKTQLFTEKRRTREKVESMQEKLDETLEELQRVTESESTLKSRNSCLEEKQKQKNEQTKALECRARELLDELGESKVRVGSLEKVLVQRERRLLDLQGLHGAFQAEGEKLKRELDLLKTNHHKALSEARAQAHAMMVDALQKQKKKLLLAQEQQIQEVQRSVVEERRLWEAEKVEAMRLHQVLLEEDNRRSLESTKSEMQQEKSKALALQLKVAELQTRVQVLEKEGCAKQREQESLVSVIHESVKEEHQAELEQLQKHMSQENQKTMLQLEQEKKEASRLRAILEKREIIHMEARLEQEQHLRRWSQELQEECQHLHLLLEQNPTVHSTVQLPPSPTIDDALTNLGTLRDQLKELINHLHHELDSQKHKTEQLSKDKEQELNLQRQQLMMQRDKELESLKERLIQEHIEELCSPKWAHVSDRDGEWRQVEELLRKQLKSKDTELRRLEKNMAQWKEQTAAHLAWRFEEGLTAELERKISKSQEEMPERKEHLHQDAPKCGCSAFVSAAASGHSSDIASLKLLRYLQRRVKQLRVENESWSPSAIKTYPLDLSPCLLTIKHDGLDPSTQS